jgi:hypothetical protein
MTNRRAHFTHWLLCGLVFNQLLEFEPVGQAVLVARVVGRKERPLSRFRFGSDGWCGLAFANHKAATIRAHASPCPIHHFYLDNQEIWGGGRLVSGAGRIALPEVAQKADFKPVRQRTELG